MTDRISQEMNARKGRLLDMKEYRTETENSLKEFRQEFSQFRQLNSEQATWQNKAGGEPDKVNEYQISRRVARLVEGGATEIQAAAQNSIQKVNKVKICGNS